MYICIYVYMYTHTHTYIYITTVYIIFSKCIHNEKLSKT